MSKKVERNELLKRLRGIFNVLDHGRQEATENEEHHIAYHILYEECEVLAMINDVKSNDNENMINIIDDLYRLMIKKYERHKKLVLGETNKRIDNGQV